MHVEAAAHGHHDDHELPTSGSAVNAVAFLGAAGITVVGALVAAALLRVPKAGAEASDAEVEEEVRLAA